MANRFDFAVGIPFSDLDNITDPSHKMDGWVGSANNRGTMDIITACLTTIGLCCWVATYPNVSALEDKWYHVMVDKLNLAVIGLLSPDALFIIAMGQLGSAMRSVRQFKANKELTHGLPWILTHAFFADMGGFHISSPDYPQGFPLNAEQLYYVLEHKYVDFPNMDLVAIEQKNAVDVFSRVLCIGSSITFLIQELQQIYFGNTITALEMTALTFAFVMICTSICWTYKPVINAPFFLQTRHGITVKEIRQIAKLDGHAFYRDKWYRTPLEFVGNRRFNMNHHWAYYNCLFHRLDLNIFSRPVTTIPWNRWPSDMLLAPEPVLFPLGFVVFAGFSASFLIAWNFYFPSIIETWIWRVCSIYNTWFAIMCTGYYTGNTIRYQWSLKHELRHREAKAVNRHGDAYEAQQMAKSGRIPLSFILRNMFAVLYDNPFDGLDPLPDENPTIAINVAPAALTYFDEHGIPKEKGVGWHDYTDKDAEALTSFRLSRSSSLQSALASHARDTAGPTGRFKSLKRLRFIFHKFTPYDDPDYNIDTWLLVSGSLMVFLYLLARVTFYFIDFFCLRKQRRSVYFWSTTTIPFGLLDA